MTREDAELIRRIASVVGHELRNPLAVINNSAYFLKTRLGADGRLDPKVEKHLGIVASEIARVDRMIADILFYSRPLEVKPSARGVAPLVEAALAALAVPSAVKLTKELGPKGLEAKVDEKLFGEALRRLLDNAVEALPNGGEVTVTVSAGKEVAVVRVRDTGPGIKPEIAPLLFSPFATTKPRGLGLGLALARKIVEAHGGQAEAGAAEGGGAEFVLTWPSA